jgi:hypothetical protein
MQLQIYIKPQDESFIREMSERAKKYEFKGVKSLSELIILALKNYDPKISSFLLNDNQSLDELIDKKLEEKIKDLKLLLDNQKASNETKEELSQVKNIEIKPIEKTEKIKPSLKEKENIEEENLDSLSKKDLVSLISDFNYTGTQRELFKKAKAKYTEKASLVNQNKAELIKVVKFLQSQ